MEDKLKEGESFLENAGYVIGSATIDMRIKRVIWEGGYIDLGWLAPSCDLKFMETKSALGRNSLCVKPPASIDEWLTLFLWFAIVYCAKYTKAGLQLFGYVQRISSLYYKHRDSYFWRLYDE